MAGLSIIAYFISLFTSLGITLVYGIELIPEDIKNQLNNLWLYKTPHTIELILDISSSLFLILFISLITLIIYKKSLTASKPFLPSFSLIVANILIISGGIVLIVHDMGNFAISDIARLYAGSTDTSYLTTLEVTGQSMLFTAKSGVAIGSVLITIGFLFFSIELIKSNHVRFAYSGILVIGIAIIANIVPDTNLAYGLYMPFMIWQLVLGIHFTLTKSVI